MYTNSVNIIFLLAEKEPLSFIEGVNNYIFPAFDFFQPQSDEIRSGGIGANLWDKKVDVKLFFRQRLVYQVDYCPGHIFH